MGSILSYLFSWISPSSPALTALDTTPDPATGLSPMDKHLITSSWALLSDKKNVKQNGVELFIQLFRSAPHMKSYFKDLKDMEEAELRTTPKLRAHGLNVMSMLTNYVQNLDDTETLVVLVTKVAKSHMRRNIGDEDFKGLNKMFIPYLRSIMGSQLTPDIEQAWNRLLKAQSGIVKATWEEANK